MSLAEKIIFLAQKNLPTTAEGFNALKRTVVEKNQPVSHLPNKTELLSAYHTLVKNDKIKANPALEKMLMRRAVRSLSGVAVITSLIKPYPCPGQCVYCPFDERMPKSYLSEEPAAMRALLLKFDPYEQMAKRIDALEKNGHPADKIEFIIKGGTWNSYPLTYQYWFILKSFEACNRQGTKRKARLCPLTENSRLADLKKELSRQQKINERARHRIIGLTLETRPDCINYHTVWHMREMGATRLEIGVQHTDDAILTLTKRGHGSAEAKRATELLRNYGFKVDFHLMPQLPGATPEIDRRMLNDIFTDPGYRPDMIKIYPCTVVKNSELYQWFEEGKYKAYPLESLIDILVQFKPTIPRYCRISRLIRDIPGQYIEEGNTVTNLRQVIQNRLKEKGLSCPCLRCREIGHVDQTAIKDGTPYLFIDEYNTTGGTEYFLSFEDAERRAVFAFCRLRIVNDDAYAKNRERQAARRTTDQLAPYPAYIRELHTYGQLLHIGKHAQEHSQHKGLGKKLIEKAEEICRAKGVKKLAVISGVGVRDYYRKWGYRLEKTYMKKTLV